MPANLTPQYHKAEEAFKEATSLAERIAALEEMLSVIPKHKGTDHLQADLKRRLSKLRTEASRPKSKKTFDLFGVEKGGAGQVVLLGAPNSGKSAVVSWCSKAPTEPTPFPFATQGPIPGMLAFEDIHIQLVDLPPITADYFPSGMLGLIKSADGVLLLADLAADSILEDLDAVIQELTKGRVRLHDTKARVAGDGEQDEEDTEAVLVHLPALLIASKIDEAGAVDRRDILRELYQGQFDPLVVSATTGQGFDDFPRAVFEMLDRIRVYSKEPGKAADRHAPFVLNRGQTVVDLAARIHRDFPDTLRQARVWGSARFDGQAVQRDYRLADGDVVELQVHRG